jgi:hypothetical protein
MKDWTDNIDPATIPDEVIMTERAKRNAAKRTSYSGGVVWGHHNPDTKRCRCAKCTTKRAEVKAELKRRPPGRPRQERAPLAAPMKHKTGRPRKTRTEV